VQIPSILWTSLVLLALAAVGGLIMAAIAFKGEHSPPVWLAMGHGFLAAAAATLLIYAAATVGLPGTALGALALLLLAAGGGVVLNLKYLKYHWNRVALPRGLIAVHATAAVAGFLLLVVAAVRAG